MDTVDKVDYDKLIGHIIQWLDDNIDSPPMGSVGVATDSQDLKEKIVLYLEGLDEFG
tara:strand:- start:256 stop:426 length:171 start_codon:yes stop_codon:yes gene_type:complete